MYKLYIASRAERALEMGRKKIPMMYIRIRNEIELKRAIAAERLCFDRLSVVVVRKSI